MRELTSEGDAISPRGLGLSSGPTSVVDSDELESTPRKVNVHGRMSPQPAPIKSTLLSVRCGIISSLPFSRFPALA